MPTHNDVGSIIEDVVLCPKEGVFGVNVPRGVWRKVESLETGAI